MKTIFDNFWYFFCAMLLVALLDLIGLGADGDFGAGFVLVFLFFVAYIIKKMRE